ncbi:MAG: hypothetical protein AAF517_20455, partial [Planctomycetota bacterium]
CIEQTLCHEMVHAMLDESWDSLPVVVEEGLCEVFSMQEVPSCSQAAWSRLLLGAAGYLSEAEGVKLRGELRFEYRARRNHKFERVMAYTYEPEYVGSLPPEEALRQGSEQRRADPTPDATINAYHYGFGAWLVQRIVDRAGYEGLRQLSIDAAASGETLATPSSVLAAARVGGPSTWRSQVLAAMDVEVLATLLLTAPNADAVLNGFADWLLGHCGPGATDEEILTRGAIEYRFEGAPKPRSLLESPRFRDRMARALETQRAKSS